MIDPRAVIDPAAKIAEGVEIGPFSIVGPDVEIGEGTVVGPHVVIKGPTTIGKNNRIFQFSTIGFSILDHWVFSFRPSGLYFSTIGFLDF